VTEATERRAPTRGPFLVCFCREAASRGTGGWPPIIRTKRKPRDSVSHPFIHPHCRSLVKGSEALADKKALLLRLVRGQQIDRAKWSDYHENAPRKWGRKWLVLSCPSGRKSDLDDDPLAAHMLVPIHGHKMPCWTGLKTGRLVVVQEGICISILQIDSST
jgi:hypothetical protein